MSISTAAADATTSRADSPPTAIALVDSHCHIVFRNFDADLDEVAARWREAGVSALVHACVEPSEIPAIRALADRFPELRYAVGVHPLDTHHWQEHTARDLRIAAKADPRVVAIGELGLDLFRESNLEHQLAVLEPPTRSGRRARSTGDHPLQGRRRADAGAFGRSGTPWRRSPRGDALLGWHAGGNGSLLGP